MKKINEVLRAENLLLKQQLAEVQKYIVGFNLGLRLAKTPNTESVDIFCSQEDVLGVLTQMLISANKCLQLGGNSPSVTVLPFYDISIFASQHPQMQQCHPLSVNMIKIATKEMDILRSMPTGGIDTIFISSDLLSSSKDDLDSLLKEALRVASIQIVVSNIDIDELNSAFYFINGQTISSCSVKADMPDRLKDFSKIRFKISSQPSSDEFFIAIFNASTSAKVLNELNSRLVLLTEFDKEKLEFYSDDLIIGDVKLMQSEVANKANFRPMFLSVLAKNLNLPNRQLRRIVANYDLLEGYVKSYKNVVAYGDEASLILKYLERSS